MPGRGRLIPHFLRGPKPDGIMRCSLKRPPAPTLWDLFILNKMRRPNWLMKSNYFNGWANKTIPPGWKDCETKGCNTSLRRTVTFLAMRSQQKGWFRDKKPSKFNTMTHSVTWKTLRPYNMHFNTYFYMVQYTDM